MMVTGLRFKFKGWSLVLDSNFKDGHVTPPRVDLNTGLRFKHDAL